MFSAQSSRGYNPSLRSGGCKSSGARVPKLTRHLREFFFLFVSFCNETRDKREPRSENFDHERIITSHQLQSSREGII